MASSEIAERTDDLKRRINTHKSEMDNLRRLIVEEREKTKTLQADTASAQTEARSLEDTLRTKCDEVSKAKQELSDCQRAVQMDEVDLSKAHEKTRDLQHTISSLHNSLAYKEQSLAEMTRDFDAIQVEQVSFKCEMDQVRHEEHKLQQDLLR